MIKAVNRQYKRNDEIDEVVGTPFYAQDYYFNDLRDTILGPHAVDLVGVTRFYLMSTPKVVVDFEPDPRVGKFYVDEKRKYFIARGIVYVPIFLKERVTKDQFAEAYRREVELTAKGHMVSMEDRALGGVDVEALLQDPEVMQAIDTEALRRADGHTKVKGAARAHLITRYKREVAAEMRKKVKDGRLGRYVSREQLALAAR